MTDQISFPPLHDLPPGEVALRRRHLLAEITRELVSSRPAWLNLPPLRPRLALPAIAVVCAAVVAVVFVGGGSNKPNTHKSSTSPLGSGLLNTVGSPPTLAQPLPLPWAKQTTLSDATATLGAPIVLPNTALVQPSDAGPVWVDSPHGKDGNPVMTNVAVTFPSQGVIVGYTRPAPSDGSAAHFQAMAQSMPSPNGGSEGHVIILDGGVPALAVQQNSDDTGHNFGGIFFNMGGSEVSVMGHNDEATLESLALSILGQSGTH
jgi:hypothetical protein